MNQFHAFAVDGAALTGVDEDGSRWTVSSIDGWYTGGAVRASVEPRSQQHGDWRGPVYRAGRLITLRGSVYTDGPVALERAARRLSAILASGGSGQFVGDSAAGVLTAMVQLEDAPLFTAHSDSWASWQMTVGSDSPHLYGPEVYGSTPLAASVAGTGLVYPLAYLLSYGAPPGPAAGSVRAGNVGTASYHPRMRVTGPATRPVVTMVETGDWVRYDGTVAAGQHLDINWGTPRRVTLGDNAVNVRHRVSFSGNWLAVPLGGGTVTFDADDADPAAQLSLWSYEGCWE